MIDDGISSNTNMGKRMKWSEIVRKYPDMWAIVSEIKYVNDEINECLFFEAVKFEELDNTILKYDSNIDFLRTTDNMPNARVL